MSSSIHSTTSFPSRRFPAPGRSSSLFSATLLAALLTASPVHANPSNAAADSIEPSSSIEEITVRGQRREEAIELAPDLLSDPLRERIQRELQKLNDLEYELEWRQETSRLEIAPPRMRIGYDPRNDQRAPKQIAQNTLPLDFMQPATVISIDF